MTRNFIDSTAFRTAELEVATRGKPRTTNSAIGSCWRKNFQKYMRGPTVTITHVMCPKILRSALRTFWPLQNYELVLTSGTQIKVSKWARSTSSLCLSLTVKFHYAEYLFQSAFRPPKRMYSIPSSIVTLHHRMHFDILGGLPLPNCPYPSSSLPPPEPGTKYRVDALHNPTVSFTFLTIGLTCLVFGIVAAAKYDSARVFNRRIRDKSVRNGWWATFFIVIGVR